MKKTILIATLLINGAAFQAQAGTIERACMAGGRKAASRALCGCIQDVADITLSWRDQRRAAKFFREPHKAQETRQSSDLGDKRFWKTYKNFGATAEAYCRG